MKTVGWRLIAVFDLSHPADVSQCLTQLDPADEDSRLVADHCCV